MVRWLVRHLRFVKHRRSVTVPRCTRTPTRGLMADKVVSGSASPSPTATARAPLSGVFPRRSRRPRELCVWVSACTAGAPRRTAPRFSAFHPTPTPFIKPAAQCGNMAGRDAGIGEFCHMAETCRWVPQSGTPVFAVVLMSFSASPRKLSMWGGPVRPHSGPNSTGAEAARVPLDF